MASRSCCFWMWSFPASSDGHDRCISCLGFQHAEAALVDDSCSLCGNMTIAVLRSRYLLVKRGGIPLVMPRSSSSGSRRATSAHGQGDLRITVRASPSSASPRASHSSSASHRLGFQDEFVESSDRAGPSISFGAPADDRMSITASGDELGSGEDDSAALPPSGRVALPESDPELTAMLSRAAESVGLHWRPPPSPERSRLDDWFLGAQADRRQPPPVPFFPEVHEEVTKSWKAPFSARNRPSASSVLTTLDGGAAQGYVEIPPVERAIAMQLCPQGAAAWRGNPRLPSRACKFSSALTAKAYSAAGQAASALQRHGPPASPPGQGVKAVARGWCWPSWFAGTAHSDGPRPTATKVTARAWVRRCPRWWSRSATYGWPWRIWGSSDKHRFLDSPISQAGLFGKSGGGLCPTVLRRTTADGGVSTQSAPAVPLLSPPHRRLQPLRLLVAERALLRPPPPLQLGLSSSLHYGHSVELAAGKRRSPSLPLPNLRSARASGGPETGDPESLDPALQEMVTAPLLPPEEGRVENLLFPFYLFRHWLSSQWYPKFKKRAVSFSPGPQEGEDGSARDPVSTLPSPSPFAYEQQGRSEDAMPSPRPLLSLGAR